MDWLVSVVVPVYNVEAYLDRCVKSIVDQTYRNIEIILVDDGSTDRSGQMCDVWAQKDNRILVIHKQNQGAGMARNTGIEYATGKFIFFLDSDDYVDVALVKKCVHTAYSQDCEIVLFGRNNVYEDGSIIADRMSFPCRIFSGETITNLLLPSLYSYDFGVGASAWSRMCNGDLLRDNKLRFVSEREIGSEDAYFSLDLFAKAARVGILNENLYYYCRRGSSLSRKFQKDRQAQIDCFLLKSIEHAQELGLPEIVGTHIQARYHGMTLGTLMQIQCSDLPDKEKRKEISKILHSQVLKNTLSPNVCKLDGRLPRIFWTLLRHRLYALCDMLLRVNAYKKAKDIRL